MPSQHGNFQVRETAIPGFWAKTSRQGTSTLPWNLELPVAGGKRSFQSFGAAPTPEGPPIRCSSRPNFQHVLEIRLPRRPWARPFHRWAIVNSVNNWPCRQRFHDSQMPLGIRVPAFPSTDSEATAVKVWQICHTLGDRQLGSTGRSVTSPLLHHVVQGVVDGVQPEFARELQGVTDLSHPGI